MVLLNAAGVRKKADGNLSIVAMTFLIVRVDHGVRNLIPWFMVPVEPHEQNQTLIGYHSRLISGKVDAAISIDRVLPNLKPTTAIKNRKKDLWNAIVKWLATMSVGWNRDEVASAGNLFVTTMTEIFWYISEKQNLLPVHARYHFSSSNFLDSISRKHTRQQSYLL